MCPHPLQQKLFGGYKKFYKYIFFFIFKIIILLKVCLPFSFQPYILLVVILFKNRKIIKIKIEIYFYYVNSCIDNGYII